jgi:hypothetical protein
MTVSSRSQSEPGPSSGTYVDEDRGSSWLIFAGTLLMVLGVLNLVEGIAAISRSHFFVGDARYVFGDLRAWGWTVLILGAAQMLIGFGVLVRNQIARWAGISIAGLNAIAQLLFIQAYPFWSLAMFALDILVIYGLIAYGGRTASTT